MSSNDAQDGNVIKNEGLNTDKETDNVTAVKEAPSELPANTEKIIRVPSPTPANNNANITAAIPPLFSAEQLSNLNTTLAETMQNFALNMDPEFQDTINYEDFSNFFTSMTDQTDAIVPLLQDIIQNALTRQILYRPFKALLDKYGPWLEENEGKISNQDLERYLEQKAILQQLCDELMMDNDMAIETDENVRVEKTNRIMSLLYRMQDLGAPPEDVTRDIMPRIHFDDHGQPVIPEGININNLENLCNIM